MHMSYPKWLYNATLPARIVNDPVEHEALGEGWEESPAAFDDEPPPNQTPIEDLPVYPDPGPEIMPTPNTPKRKRGK